MKSVLRDTVIHAFSLFLLTHIITSLTITGGVFTFLFAGFVLYIMSLLLKPVLSVLTLPFNLVTFGAFSYLTNGLIFYLLTVFVPQITVSPYSFKGASFAGFTIPAIDFNLFFTYIVAALVLSAISGLIRWLND